MRKQLDDSMCNNTNKVPQDQSLFFYWQALFFLAYFQCLVIFVHFLSADYTNSFSQSSSTFTISTHPLEEGGRVNCLNCELPLNLHGFYTTSPKPDMFELFIYCNVSVYSSSHVVESTQHRKKRTKVIIHKSNIQNCLLHYFGILSILQYFPFRLSHVGYFTAFQCKINPYNLDPFLIVKQFVQAILY